MTKIIALNIFVLITILPFQTIAEEKWRQIIENKTLNKTLRLTGSEFDNTLIRNITIENVKGDGIYIKNVKNLRIENVTLKNISKNGIRLGISGSTQNVQIFDNNLMNIGKNGINAGQRHKKGIDHKNLKIIGNTLKNVCLKGFRGLHHAIYVQTQDFYIAKNTIENCFDGNGISVRSSGIIEENKISNLGKSGITYYDDHMTGPSNLLVIKGNTISNPSLRFKRNAINLISKKLTTKTVKSFEVYNNHLEKSDLSVDPALKSRVSLSKNNK